MTGAGLPIEAVAGYVLTNLPTFLLTWAIVSVVMVGAYAALALIGRTVGRVRRGAAPSTAAEHPYPPEGYPECWICEHLLATWAANPSPTIRHQLDVHGAIRW